MKQNKIVNYIIIIIFIIFLYVPTASYFLLKDFVNNDNSENRKLATLPEISFDNLTNIPKEWDDYYNDNLPYRSNIVNNWRNLHYKLFRESLDNKVIFGKNEKEETWLFYDNSDDGDEISYIDGRKELIYEDLNAFVEKMKEETQKLKDKGIDLYYMVGPNKSSVYSQYLPDQIDIKEDYFSKAYNYLRENGVENLFYSIDTLKDASKEHETYCRTDTHWNDYGAYIYAKEFIKSIYNEDLIENPKIEEEFMDFTGRDLHKFTGLSLKLKDNDIKVEYTNNIEENEVQTDNGPIHIYENENYKIDETILIIGDSFSIAPTRHLASIYKKVIRIQLNEAKNSNEIYNEEILKQYNPNKIFYIRVERSTPDSLYYDFS